MNPPPLTVGGPPVPLTLRLDVADQMLKGTGVEGGLLFGKVRPEVEDPPIRVKPDQIAPISEGPNDIAVRTTVGVCLANFS